jgi:hypothetical protein
VGTNGNRCTQLLGTSSKLRIGTSSELRTRGSSAPPGIGRIGEGFGSRSRAGLGYEMIEKVGAWDYLFVPKDSHHRDREGTEGAAPGN